MKRLCFVAAVLGLASCATTQSPKDTKNAEIHYDLGVTQLRQGYLRDALRELLIAVESNEQMPEVHNALGLVYHSMERDDLALEHYRRAVELKPDFSEAHNNLGILLTAQGRYQDAIASYQAALNDMLYAFPAHAEGNMGWAYYKSGDAKAAVRHLRNAVATDPRFCRGYEWLARIGLEQGEPSQAVASVHRFEKHCMADEMVRKAIPIEYQTEMTFYLGQGYERLGDVAAAKASYEQCARDPDSATGARCQQSLRTLR